MELSDEDHKLVVELCKKYPDNFYWSKNIPDESFSRACSICSIIDFDSGLLCLTVSEYESICERCAMLFDIPQVECPNCEELLYVFPENEKHENEDRLHRDTNLGPAYIYFEMDSPNSMDNCGYYPPSSTIKSIYYLHGEMIRSDDGPTHIDESSVATYIEKIEYWKENDILHNDTGPAQILYNGVFLDTSEVGDPTMPTYVPIKSVWYNKGIEGKTIEHQK